MGIQELRLDVDSIKVCALPVNLIDVVWEEMYPLLKMPVDKSNGELSMESVKSSLVRGDSMALLVTKGSKIIAVNVLEVRQFPTGLRTLYISIIGGSEMDLWMDQVINVSTAIAKDLKCTELRGIAVREGWMRKLKNYGWKPVCSVIKCEV